MLPRIFHGGSFSHPPFARIPSNLRTNLEHKVLAAWLNTLRKSDGSSGAKSSGADPHDFWKDPLLGFHSGNAMAIMQNLVEVENFSASDRLLIPLTTKIEGVDSVTEICSKCNSGYIPHLESADRIEMIDAILLSLCLSCSMGGQILNTVMEDLQKEGSSCLGNCDSPGNHDCKITREPEENGNSNNVVSLCGSSQEMVSDKVEALNIMGLLPHFLFSRDNAEPGGNDALNFNNPFSPKVTSTEDNVELETLENSPPPNPLQLLPHMIQLTDDQSAKQLSCSRFVDPEQDKINLYCKEKKMSTDVLPSFAEKYSNDPQPLAAIGPTLSKRRRPKQHPETEVQDSLEQPLGCEKLDEIGNTGNKNPRSGFSGCDRWNHQGVRSRLKTSSRHSKCAYYCDKMWYKYFVAQHFNELDKAVGRRFIIFSFPMESLEEDVIYSTTADAVAFGKTSKRPIDSAKFIATKEKFGSTANERRQQNIAPGKKSDCLFARLSNKLHKPDIRMSRWWDVLTNDREEDVYQMLLERIAQSMPNLSNTRRIPTAKVINAVDMSKLSMRYLCSSRNCSGGESAISVRQSLLLSSVKNENPLWSKLSCNFRRKRLQ